MNCFIIFKHIVLLCLCDFSGFARRRRRRIEENQEKSRIFPLRLFVLLYF